MNLLPSQFLNWPEEYCDVTVDAKILQLCLNSIISRGRRYLRPWKTFSINP